MSGKNIILFRSQLKTNTPKYEAIAEFSYLNQQYLKWSGDMSLTEKKSSLSAKFEGTAHDPIMFSGDLIENGDRYTTTASIKSSFMKAKVSGRYIFLHVSKGWDLFSLIYFSSHACTDHSGPSYERV